MFCVLVQQSQHTDSDVAATQQSDLDSQGSINHTGAASDHIYITDDSTQHSHTADDQTLYDDDPYYVAVGPTEWTEVEVKKLGRRKPQDESSTNEVHSYHIDLSAYYASSQTVSTSDLFIITSTVFLAMWCTAHQHSYLQTD